MKYKLVVFVTTVSILIPKPTTIAAQTCFQGLGFLLSDWNLSVARAVSADGSVVVG